MISGFLQITPTDARQTSTTKNGVVLGSKAVTRDGKVYRWTLNGAVALAAGKMNASVAVTSAHANMALTSTSNVAVGSTKITVTLGASAVTQDQYIDAYAVVNDGAGVGQSFLIVGHPAASSSATLELTLAEPVVTLLSTSTTKITIQPNPNSSVVVAPAAATSVASGVSNVAVAASSYFWAQTRGLASVLSDGIVAKNAGSIVSASVAGAFTTELAATVTQRVAFAPDATVDTKYYPQFLLVD